VKKKIIKITLSVIISIVLITVLFNNISIGPFMTRLKSISIFYLAATILTFLIQYYFRTVRFTAVIKGCDFATVYYISLIHGFLNKIIPFRIGEISWPILMKKYCGTGLLDGLSVLMLLRFLDFIAIIFLFGASCLIVRPQFMSGVSYVMLFIFLLVLALLLFFIKPFIRITIKAFGWTGERWKNDSLGSISAKLLRISRLLDFHFSRYLLVFLPQSIILWLSIYLNFYTYTLMFHFEFSIFQVIIATALVNIMVNLLPINGFGRIGTFELGWAAGYVLIGLNREEAVPFGLFVNVTTLLLCFFSSAVGYFLLNLKYRASQVTFQEFKDLR
jgi:glycosyltransferase 2 family protein